MNDSQFLKQVSQSHPEIFDWLVANFEKEEVILKWLNTPKPMLNNQSPISLLETEPEQVFDFIHRIKTGDFS
jgi:uncharacterized protein (DUF2384 family)